MHIISNYPQKFEHFENVREGLEHEKSTDRQEADEFLNNAANVRTTTQNAQLARLKEARESNELAESTSDNEIQEVAINSGYFAAASHLHNAPPNSQALGFITQQVDNAQHTKGSTWTSSHGNLTTNTASKRRSNNTRLQNPEELHNLEEAQLGARACAPAPDSASFPTNPNTNVRALQGVYCSEEDAMRAAISQSMNQQYQPHQQQYPPHQQQYQHFDPASTTPYGVTPGPNTAGQIEPTPTDIVEVREQALENLMLFDGDEEEEKLTQVVLTNLQKKPRDTQTVQANTLLCKKGMEAAERLEKLVKLEKKRSRMKKSEGN